MRGIQHVRQTGHLRRRRAAVVFELRARTTALRLNQNDPVRRVRAIDRRRRRVAEHRDRLDIVRIDEVQRVAARGKSASRSTRDSQRHAVNDVERLAARPRPTGVDGSGSANPYRHSSAGLVVVHHLHTGDLALNELLRTDEATAVELARIHLLYGSGDVAGILLSVADHDQCRKTDRLCGETEIDVCGCSVRHGDIVGYRGIADHLCTHGVRTGGDAADHETTIGLRQRSATFEHHGHASDGLFCSGVGDASANGTGRCLLRVQRYDQQQQQRQDRTGKVN